jgi:hypothetical protein
MTVSKHGRLLLAVRPQDRPLAMAALGDEFEVVVAHTYAEAVAALRRGTDLLVCGAHFDDGRLFDLLRLVKSDPALARIPFIPVLDELPANSPAMAQSIRNATAALGADGFIDLSRMSARMGQEQMLDKLRQMARSALAS